MKPHQAGANLQIPQRLTNLVSLASTLAAEQEEEEIQEFGNPWQARHTLTRAAPLQALQIYQQFVSCL